VTGDVMYARGVRFSDRRRIYSNKVQSTLTAIITENIFAGTVIFGDRRSRCTRQSAESPSRGRSYKHNPALCRSNTVRKKHV